MASLGPPGAEDLRLQSVDPVSVLPRQLPEDRRGYGGLEQAERRARDALSGKPGRRGVVRLADTGSVSVGTGAIAAEDQLVLMAPEEPCRELRIPGEAVVSRIGGQVAKQVGIIAQQLVR